MKHFKVNASFPKVAVVSSYRNVTGYKTPLKKPQTNLALKPLLFLLLKVVFPSKKIPLFFKVESMNV